MITRKMARFGMIAASTFAVLGFTGSVLATSFSADVNDVPKFGRQKKYVNGAMMRTDQYFGNRLVSTVIYRLDKGVIWAIFDVSKRTYMEYPTPKAEAWDDLLSIESAKGKKIGDGIYLGYKCDKYKVIGVSHTGSIRSKNKLIPNKVTKITRILWYSPQLKAVVKTESKPTPPGFHDLVLSNIKEGAQPASLFELPKDLKKQTIPAPKTPKPADGSARK